MSACCFCFKPKKRRDTNQEEVSLKRPTLDHYQVPILDPELEYAPLQNDLENTEKKAVEELESVTDVFSNQVLSEHKKSLSSQYVNLYIPSTELICPCSDLVLEQFHNFEMLLDLEASTDWEVKTNKPFAHIMIKSGTKQRPDIPLVKAYFDMEIDGEPAELYEVIYDREIRKKWDTTIGEYIEIKKYGDDMLQYYMHIKAPWPFKDRDFVEDRFIRKRVNGDIEIFFKSSTNSEYLEVKDKAIRGETIIGGQIFRKRVSPTTGKPTLIATVICQGDMKGEISKKAIKVTLPTSMLKWYRSVKKQLHLKKA